MSHKFLCNASLHKVLFALDRELADDYRQSGCRFCGGCLHVSNYPRKPRGVPPAFQDLYAERLSFTCARCNLRCTPPSVRFFGRVRFVAGIPILIAALLRGLSDRRCGQLAALFGVHLSVSTWTRWRRWWRERFRATAFWLQVTGYFTCANTLGPLPAGLLGAFSGWLGERLLATLRLVSPLTGGALRAV